MSGWYKYRENGKIESNQMTEFWTRKNLEADEGQSLGTINDRIKDTDEEKWLIASGNFYRKEAA